MYYYGIRTSKISPELDLGIKYFSSSYDKEFIQDQKDNPQNYKYKVIKIYKTRKEALQLEVKLHHKFDVGINENFYNLAKQTSVGFNFNCLGIKRSPETIRKMSKPKSETHKQNMRKPKSKAHAQKIREATIGHSVSEETRKKLRKPKSEAHKQKIRDAKKYISEETRKKLSIAAKNRISKPHSEETKLKMSLAAKNRKKSTSV